MFQLAESNTGETYVNSCTTYLRSSVSHSQIFVPVRQKYGGGNRFVAYTASESPTVEDLKEKALALFFPDGKSAFAGSVDDLLLDICDATQTAIIRFPGGGTTENYLKENGLYPSRTYLLLRSQHQDTFFSQLKVDEENFVRPVNLSTLQVASDTGKHVVCSLYSSCAYLEGEECIRCEQNRGYEFSRIADGGNPYTAETQEAPETPVSLTIDEIRSRRVAQLSNGVTETEAEGLHSDVADETSYPRLTNEENCSRDQGSVEQDFHVPLHQEN